MPAVLSSLFRLLGIGALSCLLAYGGQAHHPANGDSEVGIASTRRAFHAQAGTTVHIGISSSEENPCSATISLYAPDGRLLDREYDYLEKVLPYTGRYTVRVSGCTNGLYINLYEPPPPDAYEVDDTPEAARPLATDGEPQARTLHVPLDLDWVKLDVPADHMLTIETYRLRTECDTILTLYDPDLVQIAVNDNYNGNKRSYIRMVLVRGGTYYARAHHRAGRGGKGKGYYLRAKVEVPVYAGKIKTPRRIAFPAVRVGGAYDRASLIANLRSTELLRFAVQSVEGPFLTDLLAGEVALLPHGKIRFNVRFVPVNTGPATGRIALTTTDPEQPTVVINVTGRGR